MNGALIDVRVARPHRPGGWPEPSVDRGRRISLTGVGEAPHKRATCRESPMDEEVAMTGRKTSARGDAATGISRRSLLKTAGTGLIATAGPGLTTAARAQARTLKIGYMGAQSGMRANFGETTP